MSRREPNHTTINHRLIADRILVRREELPACELARAMVQEQESFALEDGRCPYNTHRSLDALLSMIDHTALYLACQIEDVIGADDNDLPRMGEA